MSLFESNVALCRRNHGQQSKGSTLWSAFIVPPMLLESSPTPQQSGIQSLPTELLLQIFSYAGLAGRFSLALTCKRLLQVSSMTTLAIPSAAKHRAAYHSAPCTGMLDMMRLCAPLDARGHRKKTLALCCDCFRYRPKRKSYWKRARKHYPTPSDSSYLQFYMNFVQSWSSGSAYQCPTCWCEERIRTYERFGLFKKTT
ncbi:hypothetical protein F4778DRAFT_102490 [Xylariomycetidae sp. FL2044]|nr:hypothetical protein F4778DRAFT_102490 [Xylariomycetidae sp. FL2044]